jgi:hypothetical protein
MMPSLAIATCQAVARGDADQIEELRRLRAELAAACDRIEELEDILGLRLLSPPAVSLPPIQRQILGLLLRLNGVLPVAVIQASVYGARPFADWPSHPQKCIHVHVHHLRAALVPFDISIRTAPAHNGALGYVMPSPSKTRARSLFASERMT